MIKFSLFLISVHLIGTSYSAAVSCNVYTTIFRQLENEGFHIDVSYLIELVVDIETASDWENCSVVLRENITDSFYANPDQLLELNRMGISRSCTPQKVDIETPQHLSSAHFVYIYGRLTRSQNLLHSHLNFPLHLRYHRPKVNGGYSRAELKLPVLLLQCSNFYCQNLLISKAPCSDCGKTLCNWNRIPYQTNDYNISLLVPVGNSNHEFYVKPVTYMLAFGGCFYLLLSVLAEKENLIKPN